MSMKLNCWEFKKCGREFGGAKADEHGVCLTSTYTEFNGLNGGKNGGRLCWAISGTLCNGNINGTFIEKQGHCMACDFYKIVMDEVLEAELTV